MTGRFAPTPSGRMHIGNITAMLAAWLDARSPHTTPDPARRRVLLRIEDIDIPRVLPDADRWIMDDLAWLGLDWDGDPVYQSRRLDLYERALRALEDADPALVYPCFCSRADIRAASAPQEGDGFQIYPGTCRRLLRDHPDTVRDRLARGDRHSLRIAMPDSTDGPGSEPTETVADSVRSGHPSSLPSDGPTMTGGAVTFIDRVFGPQTYDLAREIGDSVIRRSDGLFAYQFVVTVDDLVTGVDSIVRGRDLLRSTALQTYIRDRLLAAGFGSDGPDESTVTDDSNGGAPSPSHPAYAHIPLIDNAAGRRLAKRERSLDMGALRARGVTAEQVIGYCAWLLRLIDAPEPCTAADLLPVFTWDPLRANPTDRALRPDDPTTPPWLAAALRA